MSQSAHPPLNPFVTALAAPPISTVQGWGKAYAGARGPLIDLSQAVPGYPPHDDLLALLGKSASSKAYASYGPNEGEMSLRMAYAAECSATYGAKISAENINITAGCNQAFVCAAMLVAGAGNAILMTNPGYFNHETTLAMMGIRVDRVSCAAENGFLPTLDAIAAAITPTTKALALVSPNNPTGAVYPAKLLADVLDLCRAKNIWLILDETYRDFLDKSELHSLFSQVNWQDNLIGLYSFSKSFCIPGHRLGAVIAAPALITEIAKIMDNLQICPPRSAQAAIAQAIPLLTDWRESNRTEITNRQIALRQIMATLPQLSLATCGAYFAFIGHGCANESSESVAKRLAFDYGVLALPGAYFGEGLDGYLRFAFANADVATINSLAPRLANFR